MLNYQVKRQTVAQLKYSKKAEQRRKNRTVGNL